MRWWRSSKSHLPIEPRPLVIREQDAYQTLGQRKRTVHQIGHRSMLPQIASARRFEQNGFLEPSLRETGSMGESRVSR